MQEYLGDNIISTTDSLPANLYKKHMDILKIVLLSLSILLLLCLYLMIRNNNVLNFRASNPLHRYKYSGRPMVYTYNLKLCSKYFRKLKNILDKFIQE